eukprot:6338906-Pyramimonas_sp.AAC.1
MAPGPVSEVLDNRKVMSNTFPQSSCLPVVRRVARLPIERSEVVPQERLQISEKLPVGLNAVTQERPPDLYRGNSPWSDGWRLR